MRIIWSLTLALLLAPAALAQPFFFGDPVPLTDTRYGAFGGDARLVSNGRDVFLAWVAEGTLRFTRVTDEERRIGRPVLEVDRGWFDVVWTGTHFLAVGYRLDGNRHRLEARIVDFTGEPYGDTISIGERFARPRLAWDGRYVLLVYKEGPPDLGGAVGSVRLTADGQRLDEFPTADTVVPPDVRDSVVAPYAPGFITATMRHDVISLAPVAQSGSWGSGVPIVVPRSDQREVAIASNAAREVLTIWSNPNAPIEAALIRNNGTVLERFSFAGTAGARAVSTVWDGSRWVIAYVAAGKAHVRRFDRAGGSEERLTAADAAADSPISVASARGQTFVAWRGTAAGNPIMVRNIDGGNVGDLAAFAAAEQTLHTAVAANDGALVVWSELRDARRTLRAGVRTSAGEWRETAIGTDEEAAFAATDGSGFAVVRARGTTWEATILNNQGRTVNVSPVATNFRATGVAWTGSAYAVIGQDTDGVIVGAQLHPSGLVGATRTLVLPRANRKIENPRVAARGGELLIVWQDTQVIGCFPVCDMYDSLVHGARFTAAFDRIDPTPFSIAPDESLFPDVTWDGTRYVIVWSQSGKVQYRTLRTNGAISGTTAVDLAAFGRPRVAAIDGGVAIVNESGNAALLYQGNTIVVSQLGRPGQRDALVPIGGGLAYVQAGQRNEMPYHGAMRLQLRYGDLFPPAAKPAAPTITRAELPPGASTMVIEWTAPPGEVLGYRVEYRVNHGAWNELDEWFDADDRILVIRPWRPSPAVYEFRVRAWSEAGVGAYSQPAKVTMPGLKQRVVRK